MALETLIPPAEEPVSLAEARAWLRLGTDGEDGVLVPAIAAARATVEARTGRALVSRTVRERFSRALTNPRRFGDGVWLIASLRPVTALVAVSVASPAGVSSPALAPAPAGLLRLEAGQLRLTAPARDLVVDYVAGHGAASAVPMADRVAVLEELAAILARRDSGEAPPATPVPQVRL